MKTAHSNGVKMPKVLHEVNTGMEPVEKHTCPNMCIDTELLDTHDKQENRTVQI